MTEAIDLFEIPDADEINMVAGWRQWADAGSVSSGLPEYLIKQLDGRPIGSIRPDGFYLYQIPGTHGLVRPVVKFNEGYPESLEVHRNDFFFVDLSRAERRYGLVIFLGDEPHMDIERYTASLLEAAHQLRVRRIIGLGGVYGELPYDKDRMISSIYSLPRLKEEVSSLAVNLSDYQGGASIGSYVCKRAGDRDMEYLSLYAFVPTYDFSNIEQLGSSVRIENDYTAWLGVMQRMSYMLKLGIDLSDLEQKSRRLTQVIQEKVDDLDRTAPELDLHAYMKRLSDDFTETSFAPLDDVWEDELRRLLDKFEDAD